LATRAAPCPLPLASAVNSPVVGQFEILAA
jgi:hypothetical protein